MTISRTATVGQTVLMLTLTCLLMPTDTHAQFQASSLASSSLAFESRNRAGSTKDTITIELRLPSESKATLLSTAFTLIPIGVGVALMTSGDDNDNLGAGLAGAGILFGPSIGYFYGGCTKRGLTGINIRSLVAVGTVIIWAGVTAGGIQSGRWKGLPSVQGAIVIGAVGAGLIAVLAIYDIVEVQSSVEKQNRQRKLSTVRLSPNLSADGQTWGMTLSMAF